MLQKDVLKDSLTKGTLYRRSDLEQISRSVDRHLAQLVKDKTLKKVAPGLYLMPLESKWGEAPADDKELVAAFLKDDRFLIFSYSSYNGLNLGTTQLYNHTIVYNHKRNGQFKLGNRTFDFRMKHDFPKQFDRETLVVDMLNNLSELAEDHDKVLESFKHKITTFNKSKLEVASKLYGKVQTKKLIRELIRGKKVSSSRS